MNLRETIRYAFLTALFSAMLLLTMPLVSAAQEKIAFASDRDGNYEIYSMNADGSNQTRLTNNSAYDSQPSFSRDGAKIAFHSNREGSLKIYMMNADGSNVTRLTNNPADDFNPTFNPDGNKIAFLSNRDGNQEIYIMNSDGTSQTRLTNDPAVDTKPSFSNDSTVIAFESNRGGNTDIYKIGVDGTGLVRLTTDPGDDGSPSFRPDTFSSKIVFHSNRDGNYEIYDMYSDGTNQTRLTINSADDRNPTHSRNGSRIIFESTRDGNSEIYDMYANGADQVRLTNNAVSDLAPSGGGLPVVQVIAPINGVTPTLNEITINNSAGYQFDPHVSGDWATYSDEPTGTIHYYNFVTNVDAEISRGASLVDRLAENRGGKIVFSRAFSDTDIGVMIFDAATPNVAPVRLTTIPGSVQFDCSIGGDTVAFMDYGAHTNGDLVVYDIPTGVTTRLTNDTGPENNLEGPEVSDDGNVIVWSRTRLFPFHVHSEVWQAVKSAGIWKISIVSTAPEFRYDSEPDTNGSIVTYQGTHSNFRGIFWRSVTGGKEFNLQLPTADPGLNTLSIYSDPNITGNYIAFGGSVDIFQNAYDLYLYDIAHNRLYQITNTPGIDEFLCEIAVLPDGRVRLVWTNNEEDVYGGNIHAATFRLPSDDTTPPVLDPLTNITVSLPLNSTATSMPVTFPTPTATDDSGSATVTTNPISGAVFPVGTTTVNVTAADPTGNISTGSFTVTVLHNFSGFLQPVDPLPTLNLVNAGQAVPVNFSLSGNKGLNIFASGYPASSQIICTANEPGSVIEETVSAGGSSLSYAATTDQYSYVWKTDKAWKGTCRILNVRLKDGSDHFAKFRFK